ncbi:MAG TPA: glycosyltransferase [Blastococcus sp.]|jgi:glycosyltransferase involved in cell wall biosynthesis|nr:glycosyltransferase [Blastococcus sp.]
MTPVLFVLPSLARGGAERHTVLMATTMDPARWHPHVLAFEDGPFRADLERAGVAVEVAPLPRGLRAVRAGAAAVRATLDRTGAQVVSVHHARAEAAVRLALRGRPMPNITWKHTYGHIGYRGLRERLFERLTGTSVTRYGAVCHTQVRYLTGELGLPAERIRVVPNSVAVPDAPAALPAGSPTVLMMAAMRPDKGHSLLLQAWPTVLAHHPDARLRLAGDGPCRAALMAQATDLGIAPTVEFLGVRDDTDRLLRDASLVVLASYTVECFPYAALEAMAVGRGVVSTDVGGLPELVDDGVTGRLVPPGDDEALARAVLEGLADAVGPAPRWGTAGWDRVRRVFPLDSWAARIGGLFDDLLHTDGVHAPRSTERTLP